MKLDDFIILYIEINPRAVGDPFSEIVSLLRIMH